MATIRKVKLETRSPAPAPAAKVASNGGDLSSEKVAARAYEIWQESGRPDGRDRDHWFQAERELRTGRARRPN